MFKIWFHIEMFRERNRCKKETDKLQNSFYILQTFSKVNACSCFLNIIKYHKINMLRKNQISIKNLLFATKLTDML